MEEKYSVSNAFLAGIVGIALLAACVIKALNPAVIVPVMNIPAVLAMVLAALLIEQYTCPGRKHNWVFEPLLAALTFGLLPWITGYFSADRIWKLGVIGGFLYFIVSYLFESIAERVQSGFKGRVALTMIAFVFFLAGECFSGILL